MPPRKGHKKKKQVAGDPNQKNDPVITTTAIPDEITGMTFPELEHRKTEIEERLRAIQIEEPPSLAAANAPAKGGGRWPKKHKPVADIATAPDSSAADYNPPKKELIPYNPKVDDTHWDFCMKEMMWLGADFQAERKRQYALGKKCAQGIKTYHKTKESRRLRELAQAEQRRRKLAAKIGRDTKQWWTKIEKLISYKQKLSADEERKKAMNKQLVTLVQQTEKYSELLASKKTQQLLDGDDDSDDNDDDDDDEDSSSMMMIDSADDPSETSSMEGSSGGGSGKQRRRRRRRKHHKLTIEEALAMDNTIRKSKKRIIDYSRMKLESNEFYGESTASDGSGSDGSYHDDDYDSDEENSGEDDETTLIEAIQEELKERRQKHLQQASITTFWADPEELRKLHEEKDMEIDLVLERFQEEATAAEKEETEAPPVMPSSDNIDEEKQKRKVQFAFEEATSIKDKNEEGGEKGPDDINSSSTPEAVVVSARTGSKNDDGNDADDDGDASDVEDYKFEEKEDDQEFEAVEPEMDDETTMIQEESLPQEMSSEQEIDLLKSESEMSIEELRAKYAKMKEDYNNKNNNEAQLDDDSESEEAKSNGENELSRESAAVPSDATTVAAPTAQANAATGDNVLLSLIENMDNTNGEDGAGEYVPDGGEGIDDETTLEAEERMGRDMTYDEEINLLQQESEIPVEQLRAMYAKMNESTEERDDDSDELDQKPPPKPVDDKATADGGSGADMFKAYQEGAGDDDNEDYKLNEADAVDDETTIEIEERMGRDITYEEEMDLLQKENEIPVEKLREMYGFLAQGNADEDDEVQSMESEPASVASEGQRATLTNSLLDGGSDATDADAEEFKPEESELLDDETTMEAEERLGRDMSYEEEIELLNRENEMSVEELRKMYAGINSQESEEGAQDGALRKKEDDDIDEEIISSPSIATSATKRQREMDDESFDTRPTKTTCNREDGETTDDGQAALDALEASAERARQTLATRPYLLAGWVKLRIYQQIGLNWLVSLQSRRLNGILADGKFVHRRWFGSTTVLPSLDYFLKEMGLGKTLQTISLLSYLASYKGIWGPHLVVVPTSVIINWETELKRFCPALKVLCYYGSAKRRKELRTGWTKVC